MSELLRLRTGFLIFAYAILLQGAPLGAQVSRGSQGEGKAGIDYASARREIQAFETVLNNVISATFNSSPFALVQKTKGAYLPGYGLSFYSLINIHRAMVNTPFGEIRRFEDITPEMKQRRIGELTEKLMRALQENGESFRQLRSEETVTIVAFFEDRNFPEEANQNKTVVMSASKRDLQELGSGSERLKEFKQRLKVIEY